MARVLSEEEQAGRCRVRGVVLSDQTPSRDLGVKLRFARTSRAQFVAEVTAAHFTHTHFIYDFAGMARAHQLFPWPRRSSLTFLHGIEVWSGTAVSRHIRAACQSDRLLANTDFTRTRASAHTSGFARASVCWLATEEESPPKVTRQTERPPRALILGRLVEDRDKGHEALLRCWPTVRESVPNAVLTIVGTGPALPRFQKLAAALPAGSVEVRGFVPEVELPRLWAETSVFAMPSRGEGFGLVYIEAMRYGIPVIASVHDAGPEVNLEGITGYNVNLDRPEELPDRLVHLLRNPDHAAKLGANGIARWGEHFRYSAFRKRFLPILHEFLKR